MSNWSPWDWISYGCLGISAIGLAIAAAPKALHSKLKFSGILSSTKWSYAPALFFLIATVIFIARLLYGEPLLGTKDWTKQLQHLEGVNFKSFVNEQVELDGKAFQDCDFTGVTLVFRGKHPFTISHCSYNTPLRIKVPQGPNFAAARSTLDLVREITTQIDTRVRPLDQLLIVEPISPQ